MTDHSKEVSPLKQAYFAIEKLQSKLEALEADKRAPIAIIGMGCRYPGGADNPQAFWQLLRSGQDAIREIPKDRFDIDAYYDPDPDAPGKIATRWGAFLDSVDQFEPQFFGISPREAISMDPQQRLLLEVAWEALEHAGVAPDSLYNSPTGVYVGVSANDYAQVQREAAGLDNIDPYYSSGVASSIVSGRLSYVLGLQGPAVSIDTACSSSLVATHLAVQALRAGECNLALAGGVYLMLSPENSVALSKYHMLSPDGRCKAFDEAADGFGQGEGCGVVVLKRLTDALADGDNILAVIRGSAINQDGPSSGLTAPNGPSQEAVIRAALANAGLKPSDVGYIETHGTGTSLGDPIEVNALGAVFSDGRQNPLLIGSVKANIGHTVSAAGVAGLMKAVFAVQHGEVPPLLNLNQLSSFIPWADYPISVPTEVTPWGMEGRARVAGVSSFGFSGTNAHIVIEQAPVQTPRVENQPERPLHVMALSARTKASLKQAAARYENQLRSTDVNLPDVAYTANTGRAKLAERLAVLAADAREAADKLAAFANGDTTKVISGQAPVDRPKVAFLFTGQGSQYAGMGRELYDSQPDFRAAFDECDALMRDGLGRSLFELFYGADTHLLNDTRYTQPALFALEYALSQMWRAWGVEPDWVLGHSVGEYVAAVLAGVMSLADGARLIMERGRLMSALPAGGQMAAVFADEATVLNAIAPYAREVSIAAVNAPAETVISGAGSAIDALLEDFKAEGIKAKRLNVSHAFHSPLMEPMLTAFERAVKGVQLQKPQAKLVSNLTGAVVGAEVATPGYWTRHVREAVRFADSIQTLYNNGCRVFLEIGPKPTLMSLGQRSIQDGEGLWLPTLREGKGDWNIALESLAHLWVAGVPVDWSGFDRAYPRQKVHVPTYPFERQRYWVKTVKRAQKVVTGAHPLLGAQLRSPLKTQQYEAELTLDGLSFLNDHRVFGMAVLPGTGYIETALAAGRQVFGDAPFALQDLSIREALVMADEKSRALQTVLTPDGEGYTFQLYSQADGETDWTLHAEARLLPAIASANDALNLRAVRAGLETQVSADAHYARLASLGLPFGDSLRGVQDIWRREGESLAFITAPEAIHSELSRYGVHPALLDACLQPMAEALPDAVGSAHVYTPLSFDQVQFFAPLPEQVWSHVKVDLTGKTGVSETYTANIALYDADGLPLAQIDGIRLKRTQPETMFRGGKEVWRNWLYEVAWRPVSAEDALPSPVQLAEAGAADRLSENTALRRYAELRRELDALSRGYVLAALAELGFNARPGTQFTLNTVLGQLHIQAKYSRLTARLLDMLVADGLLRRETGESWTVVQPLTGPTQADLGAEHSRLSKRFPEFEAELALLGACGAHLAGVLAGTADPLELLFPGGNLSRTEKLYTESPVAKVYNGLVQSVLKNLTQALPPERPLRILEIGAGTGGTTGFVLPCLPADRVSYTFTDISPLFGTKARQKFKTYPFMQYETLNIENDPLAQGFGAGAYDLIIAANVIHATADLRRTLDHVRRLLAPGGLLLMLEMTYPERWVDLTFGLTDGWWLFEDDFRPDYLLLDTDAWKRLLLEMGFAQTATLPDGNAFSEQAVILGQMPTQAPQAGNWLLLPDEGGVAAALADCIHAAGGKAELLSEPGDLPKRLSQNIWDGLLYLRALDMTDAADLDGLRAQQADVLGGALRAAQALAQATNAHKPRLWLLTRGAVPGGDVRYEQSPVWGMSKTITLEHPELRPVCLDLDPAGIDLDALFNLIHQPTEETQLALRGGQLYAARLAPYSPAPANNIPAEQVMRLDVGTAGLLDTLAFQPAERRAPERNEVEIRVRATGLNFKDVLNAMGMYPGNAGPLGGECAGEVVAVGEGVTDLKVGDGVIALTAGSFSTYLTLPADLVVRKPEHLTYGEAAALAIPFITAYYTLVHLGGMRAGDRVLIHAAAGGVGLAAVQLAQRAGAEIFATAGSPEKQGYLRSLGVQHILNSRSLDFVDDIRALTNGRGVDVVLNSLADEFCAASLSVMAENGRFLEIGKRGILIEADVAAQRPDVAYHIVDWSIDARDNPALIRDMLLEIVRGINAGELHPLPHTTFPAEQIVDAFRYMAGAKHIGKIVVTYPASGVRRTAPT
jgi:acyl transferase domain-containing protein/NADPH:quinone reductase-like Zn-dependent oxidoreductase/SAM-dependent methyltransferase